MDRSCGSCTVCCIVPPIKSPTFSKQSSTSCEHCTASGCSIYLFRPQACRDFLCGWRSLPFLDARWQPDKCGLMIVPEEENVPPEFQRRQGLNFTVFRNSEDLEQAFVVEMIAGLAPPCAALPLRSRSARLSSRDDPAQPADRPGRECARRRQDQVGVGVGL